MMRRRFYGEERLEAFPLVAPVHADGTYLTPSEIASQLGSVNIIDKYNASNIPFKKYAYTINNSLTTFTTPNIDGDFWYYEKVNGVEKATKYAKNTKVAPTIGSTDRYVIACGESVTEAFCREGGEWIFTGKCNGVTCQNNANAKYIHISNSFNTLGQRNYICSYSGIIGKLTIPKNISTIGQGAFIGTKIQGTLDLPEGVETILYQAFAGCTYIDTVNIPKSIKSIIAISATLPQTTKTLNLNSNYYDPLIGFTRELITINLGENATDYRLSDDNKSMYYDNGISKEFVWLKKSLPTNFSLVIEEGTQKVSEKAAQNSANLSQLYTPNSIISYGASCFNGCNLKSIDFGSSQTDRIVDSIFSSKVLTSLNIRTNSLYAWGIMLYANHCEITIDESVTYYRKIEDDNILIYGETDIEYYVSCQPDYNRTETLSVSKNILTYAFRNCVSLSCEIDFSNVISVETHSFNFCSNVYGTINLSDEVINIPSLSFSNCALINSLTIPSFSVLYSGGYGPFVGTGITEIFAKWKDSYINEYNTSFGLSSELITLHIPQGQKDNYAAKGWTDDKFSQIIDDIL